MSASLAGLFVPWVLLIQPSLAASAVTPAGLSTSVSQNVHEVISSMTPSTMSPSTITQAPFLPHDLRRRQSTAVFTESTEVRGNISTVTDGDSVCGFVTNDIHWPVYCGYSQFCNTLNPILECCTGYTQSSYTSISTSIVTFTSNDRNSYTTTITTTQSYTSSGYRYSLTGCAGWSTCVPYADRSSCTGDCASSNIVCTDEGWPFCATLFSTSFVSTKEMYAQSWFCDTIAYSLEYDNAGFWPSYYSDYLSTYTYNADGSTAPTWTPTIVPFSQKQMSQPATGPTAPTPTPTSGASSHHTPSFSLGLGILSLCTLLIFAAI